MFKTLLILTLVCVTSFVATIFWLVFSEYYLAPKYGLTWKGISQAHSRAMEEGRYDDAIKWAKKGIKEYGDSLGFPKMLAAAYEMNGDYEEIIETYQQIYAWNDYHYGDWVRCRIVYKQGDTREAFYGFCDLIQKNIDAESAAQRALGDRQIKDCCVEFNLSPSDAASFHEEASQTKQERYDEFLAFMESEYDQLGRPEEYEKVISYLRSIR